MVKCKICIEEKGESDDYHHLTFHLEKKHRMFTREYKEKFPDAHITSSSFRQKQRKLMLERRKNIPDLEKKLHRWRYEERESDYPDVFENPSIDDLETLKQREKWCCQMLGSGITGERYKRIYKDLMECRRALEVLFEQLMRES